LVDATARRLSSSRGFPQRGEANVNSQQQDQDRKLQEEKKRQEQQRQQQQSQKPGQPSNVTPDPYKQRPGGQQR
jgi:hypothetical protein